MKRILFLLLLIATMSIVASAQTPSSTTPASTKPIQDNSFLVEEAYNQEYNVIQHISSFTKDWTNNTWVYTFTQEWPFPGHEKHQLSYTVSGLHSGDFRGSGTGFGDVLLNYRYQLIGNGESKLAFSPRLSLVVPTGSARFGRGAGGTGIQTMLPFSLVLNRKLVTHLNAGATFVPHAKNELGDRAFTNGYNLGQSFIWLAKPRFNVMLETIWGGGESVVAKDSTQRYHYLLMSPGVRWAYNFKNGLQIVPGVAFPVGVGPSQGDRQVLFYLSFEHPIGPTEKN